MKRFLALSVVLAALAVAIGVTPSAYAQDTRVPQTATPQPDHGMMGGDMSGMMTRMNKMMDACEKMMQGRQEKQPKGRRG